MILLLALVNMSIIQAKAVNSGDFGAGNGGDGVACKDSNGKIISVTLFDYHEAKRRHPDLILDLGPKELDYKSKVSFVISRLSKINPSRARAYKFWFDEFESNTERLRNIRLSDIPDVGDATIPNNCDMEQIAVQKELIFETDKRYTINQDLFEKMDEDSKAGLILHELAYREALAIGHKNSIFVRFFNAFISSKKMNGIKHEMFINMIKKSHYVLADANGVPFLVAPAFYTKNDTDIEYFDNGNVKNITINRPDYYYGDGRLKIGLPKTFLYLDKPPFFSRNSVIAFIAEDSLKKITTFYENGNFKSGLVLGCFEGVEKESCNIKVRTKQALITIYNWTRGSIFLNEQGMIESVTPSNSTYEYVSMVPTDLSGNVTDFPLKYFWLRQSKNLEQVIKLLNMDMVTLQVGENEDDEDRVNFYNLVGDLYNIYNYKAIFRFQNGKFLGASNVDFSLPDRSIRLFELKSIHKNGYPKEIVLGEPTQFETVTGELITFEGCAYLVLNDKLQVIQY